MPARNGARARRSPRDPIANSKVHNAKGALVKSGPRTHRGKGGMPCSTVATRSSQNRPWRHLDQGSYASCRGPEELHEAVDAGERVRAQGGARVPTSDRRLRPLPGSGRGAAGQRGAHRPLQRGRSAARAGPEPRNRTHLRVAVEEGAHRVTSPRHQFSSPARSEQGHGLCSPGTWARTPSTPISDAPPVGCRGAALVRGHIGPSAD